MGSKKKGTRAERELMHMFYESKRFLIVRAAGSGSTTLPCPDLIVGNKKRKLAIECKSVKRDKKYFDKEEIKQLLTFSKKFGAEPWLAVRFDNNGWYFLKPGNLEKSRENNPCLSLKRAKKKGLSFEKLIKL